MAMLSSRGDDYDDLDAAEVKIYVEGQEFGPYSLQEDYTVTLEGDDDDQEE